MQNESWMQPALNTSEAVLLPALERRTISAPRFGNRYFTSAPSNDAFLPVEENWGTSPSHALSTYVRPRGSMAGRSVLRAAGIRSLPMSQRPFHFSNRSTRTHTSSRLLRK